MKDEEEDREVKPSAQKRPGFISHLCCTIGREEPASVHLVKPLLSQNLAKAVLSQEPIPVGLETLPPNALEILSPSSVDENPALRRLTPNFQQNYQGVSSSCNEEPVLGGTARAL